VITSVDFVVTSTANDDEVLRDVLAAFPVMLQMVQFENTGVVGRPTVGRPTADSAGVVVAFVNLSLHFLGDTAVVRFRDAFCRLKDVLAHVQVGATRKPGRDGKALFRAKLTNATRIFSSFLRGVSEILGFAVVRDLLAPTGPRYVATGGVRRRRTEPVGQGKDKHPAPTGQRMVFD
jgi:hypothetical protein